MGAGPQPDAPTHEEICPDQSLQECVEARARAHTRPSSSQWVSLASLTCLRLFYSICFMFFFLI